MTWKSCLRHSPTTSFATLLLIGGIFGVAPARADAVVEVGCVNTNHLVLNESNTDYVVAGSCEMVDVRASNTTVTIAGMTHGLAGETRVGVYGANATVTVASPVDMVYFSGEAANSMMSLPAVPGVAELRSSNSTLRIQDIARVVQVGGSNNTIISRGGTMVKVRGTNNSVKYRKLRQVVVRGANNTVKVRTGKTKVRVTGANNVVRVHRRG